MKCTHALLLLQALAKQAVVAYMKNKTCLSQITMNVKYIYMQTTIETVPSVHVYILYICYEEHACACSYRE